jgi:hypothetical protein
MIRLLIWARFRSFWNGLTRTDRAIKGRARRAILFTILVGVAVGFLGYGFIEPFAAAAGDDPAIRLLLARAPALGLFSAFWLLVLSGVTAGIQTFYLNPEIGLLLSAPTRPASLVAAKLIEATLANAALFLSTAAPLLLAYGLALDRITAGYVITLAVLLLAFSVLPTGIGVLTSMILMRILPAGRTRDALAAAGVALFALAYFALSTGVTRIQRADPVALRGAADRLLTTASSPLLRHGPWAWAGDVLAGLPPVESLLRIGALVVLACVSVTLCSALARPLFFAGWSAAQEADSGATVSLRPQRLRMLAGPVSSLAALLPPPVRAVFVKDILSMTRDMRQLSMLFIPVAVIGVFIANLHGSPPASEFGALLFIQTLLVILAPVSLRIALAAYVAENRAFWLIMEAPNPPTTSLLGKYAFACVLSLPIGLLAAGAYAWVANLTGVELLISLCVVMSGLLAFCGIGIGASARFCDFAADNARFTMTSGGRMLVLGIQLVFLAGLGALNVASWAIIRFGGIAPLAVMIAQAAAGLLMAVCCVWVMLGWGAARLRKLEW